MLDHRSITELLLDNKDAFHTQVFANFYHSNPYARATIAPSEQLTPTVISLIGGLESDGKISDAVKEKFLEHTKLLDARGFHHYTALASAVRSALQTMCADLPLDKVLAAEQAITSLAADLNKASNPREPIRASVVEVERRSRRISVVRLITEETIDYRHGDFLQVTTELLNGHWRYLYPAIPANKSGHIEFHILRDELTTPTGALTTAREGDEWLLGLGEGHLYIPQDTDLLLIAHSTGLASLRPIILDLMAQSDPPRVHLFFGADYPGELYELAGLWQLAATAPWLSVSPIVKNNADAWWVQPSKYCTAPRGLHIFRTGQAGEVAASYGNWRDRSIIISGPEEDVQTSRTALILAGTPSYNIQTLSFSPKPWYLP